MREIKFRAWDLGAESMVDWESIKLHFSEHVDHEMVVVMQYTGINDKNGKEIYEGDISKEPAMYETPENTTPIYNYFEVTYDNCSFQSGGIPMIEDIDWISEESEVVGNIYENPELLKRGE